MGNLQEAVRRIIEDTCVDCGGTFKKFVCATSRVRCDNCRNTYRYRKYGIKIPTKEEQAKHPEPPKQVVQLHEIDNRVEKTCEVCKGNFKVKKNLASTARRCNKCQRAYVQQLQP